MYKVKPLRAASAHHLHAAVERAQIFHGSSLDHLVNYQKKIPQMNHEGREFFHCLCYFVFLNMCRVCECCGAEGRGSLRLLSPPSLLCTGVWSCFLMSSGTTGAIALCPSVLTFSMCFKAFIDPLCIHTFTKHQLVNWSNTNEIHAKRRRRRRRTLSRGLSRLGVTP